MRQFHLILAALVLVSGLAPVRAQDLLEESLRIPMPEAGSGKPVGAPMMRALTGNR